MRNCIANIFIFYAACLVAVVAGIFLRSNLDLSFLKASLITILVALISMYFMNKAGKKRSCQDEDSPYYFFVMFLIVPLAILAFFSFKTGLSYWQIKDAQVVVATDEHAKPATMPLFYDVSDLTMLSGLSSKNIQKSYNKNEGHASYTYHCRQVTPLLDKRFSRQQIDKKVASRAISYWLFEEKTSLSPGCAIKASELGGYALNLVSPDKSLSRLVSESYAGQDTTVPLVFLQRSLNPVAEQSKNKKLFALSASLIFVIPWIILLFLYWRGRPVARQQ